MTANLYGYYYCCYTIWYSIALCRSSLLIIIIIECFQYGREKSLAHSAAIDYHLDNSTEDALMIFIKEFEMKLKFKEL